jgi:hypothetical protein
MNRMAGIIALTDQRRNRILVTKQINPTQNVKIISRKDAKDAKKIIKHLLILVLNQKIDFDSRFPLRSLRLCERRLLVPACPG